MREEGREGDWRIGSYGLRSSVGEEGMEGGVGRDGEAGGELRYVCLRWPDRKMRGQMLCMGYSYTGC